MQLYNRSIRLGKSYIFLRLALIIYGFGVMVLFATALCAWFKAMILLALIVSCAKLLRRPLPYPKYAILEYRNNKWFLINNRPNRALAKEFDSIRLITSLGIFLILELRNTKQSRILVVFADQISSVEYRELKIHAKFMQK